MTDINRRAMLGVTAGGITLASCATPSQTKDTDMTTADLSAQIAHLKNGDIKTSELLEDTIARIELLNPKVEAVITPCYDRARAFINTIDNNSVCAGAPMLIKDLNDVAGVRTTYGSGAFANFTAPVSGDYVARVEAAGLTIIGKTNTPELGLLPVTEPRAYTPSRNPWNTALTTGGSSGGAAAAVASGMMPCAQGSDGGGSIRIPSHYCGLFGLKPSRGRVAYKQNSRPFSISVNGALSKTVRDSALMLSLTETPDSARNFPAIGMVRKPIGRPLKIGLAMNDYFLGQNIADAEVTNVTQKAAKLCESLGHNVEIAMPPVYGQLLSDAFLMLWSSIPHEVSSAIRKLKGGTLSEGDFEPWTLAMAEDFVTKGGAEALKDSITLLKQAEAETVAFLKTYDVIISPVMPTAAHPLGKYKTSSVEFMEEGFAESGRSVGYTAIYNVAGAPCMSVPLYRSPSGLPIGTQFISAPGNDALLLQLAYQLEEALPWIESYPNLL